MLTHSKISRLCTKALQNDLSENEMDILNSWMEKSPANKAEFNHIKKMWTDLGSLPVNPPAVDLKNEWAVIEKKINAAQKSKPDILNRFYILKDRLESFIPFTVKTKPRLAFTLAALIMALIISVIIFQNLNEKEIRYQTFSAANKQKVDVRLSDGSSIKLNSGSSIIVRDEFDDDKREVKLNGEAYFDVAKENRPCIILTDNAKIEVLGTSFNVWTRDNQTRVIVKEGTVRLSAVNSDHDFVLVQADQMSQVIENETPIGIKNIQADRYIGWIEGKLVFEHCPLDEFIGEIERQYNIDVDIQPENIKHLKLTGTFDNLPIDQVLASVCLTFDLDYSSSGQNSYVLRQK
ncbi:MAG: FecR domain-containing protein [Calditrichaceae bacterium]|nr:FecR domain-containing protein [Calditrichaceae bacterium]